MGGALTAVLPYALGGAALLALVRTVPLRDAAPGLAIRQRLGIALVATPLVALLLVGAISAPSLFDAGAAAPLTPDTLSQKAWLHLGLYLALPLVGLALVLGAGGLLAAARRRLIPAGDPRRQAARTLTATAACSTALVAVAGIGWTLGRAYGGELLTGAGAAVVFSQTTPALALALAGVAAVAEEVLFRGVLLEQLRRPFGGRWALVLQAALFGLIHAGYGSWVHVLAAAAFGIVAGLLATRRGLGAAVGTHFLVNVALLGLWADHALLVGFAIVGLGGALALAGALSRRSGSGSTGSPSAA